MKINSLIDKEEVGVNVQLKIEIVWKKPADNEAEKGRRDMIQKTFDDHAKDLAVMIHNIVTGKEKPMIIKPN